MRFFTSDFFPMNLQNSTAENVLKIAELKLSSCGLEVADFRKNCDCGIAELRLQSNIYLKVAELRLQKSSFKLRNCDCGLKKMLRVPTSA